MSKYTPGPWYIADTANVVRVDGSNRPTPTFEIGSFADACWIAAVQDHRRCGRTPSGDANARLIAAAPDLLESLKELVRVVEGTLQGYGMIETPMRAARAAIFKAEDSRE